MKLIKKKARAPYDKLYDFYLTWSYNKKEYRVRVRPSFPRDNKLLVSQAVKEED